MIDQNINPYDLKNLELYHPDEFNKAVNIYEDDFDIIVECDNGDIFALDCVNDRFRKICRNRKLTDEEFMKEFAYRLKRKIRLKGLTHKQFAECVGLGESSISGYCTGKRLPTVQILYKMSNVLNCLIDDFNFVPRD